MMTTTRGDRANDVTKKRNPQDLTLRNLRALKARVLALEDRVRTLELALIGKKKGR